MSKTFGRSICCFIIIFFFPANSPSRRRSLLFWHHCGGGVCCFYIIMEADSSHLMSLWNQSLYAMTPPLTLPGRQSLLIWHHHGGGVYSSDIISGDCFRTKKGKVKGGKCLFFCGQETAAEETRKWNTRRRKQTEVWHDCLSAKERKTSSCWQTNRCNNESQQPSDQSVNSTLLLT